MNPSYRSGCSKGSAKRGMQKCTKTAESEYNEKDLSNENQLREVLCTQHAGKSKYERAIHYYSTVHSQQTRTSRHAHESIYTKC